VSHPWGENTPGSAAAVEKGCRCAVMDNGRGRGYLGGMKDEDGNTMFVITVGCPVHSLGGAPSGETATE
jgi:hypothetical protein